QIGPDATIPFISSYGMENLSTSWTFTEGSHELYVVVDPEGAITELSEDNNVAFTTVSVFSTTPPSGSVSINNGDEYSRSLDVLLSLPASGGNPVTMMAFSHDNATWSDWEPYSTSRTWTLEPGDGTKTVYVKFMDASGLISEVYSDDIILDATPPTVTGQVPVGTSVLADTNITVIFSEAMNHSTAESSFTISPSVTGSFSWENNTLVFTPSANLIYGQTYTVMIGKNSSDLIGNNMSDNFSWEFTVEPDTDGDGTPDSLDSDDDDDGLPDSWEEANGLNRTNPSDSLEDTDNDGLTNVQEFEEGTDPQDPDTDGDGVKDGDDLYPTDSSKWKREEPLGFLPYLVIGVVVIAVVVAISVFLYMRKRLGPPVEAPEEEGEAISEGSLEPPLLPEKSLEEVEPKAETAEGELESMEEE
ncbi:MAG: Ig-like domain-containing protein, partial [Thermoplasmata archaeon]